MKRWIVDMLEWLCGRIDNVPTVRRYDGRLHVEGSCWGCYPLRLSHLSAWLDERWQTGHWR